MPRSCGVGALAALWLWAGVVVGQATGPVESFTLHASQDEGMVRAFAHREITGEYQLDEPYRFVALTLELYQDGKLVEPIRLATLKDNAESAGRLGVMLADLERLPTVKNTQDSPLQLAPPRSIFRLVIMTSTHTSTAFGPIDTAKLFDLHNGVTYLRLNAAAASVLTSPLLVMYQGEAPVQREGVRSVADFLQRNPQGHVAVISLRGTNDGALMEK
ncbi:MAG: hypothetical protein IT424_01205 [Pirellulales bacterium]|nr:hypothetical protein [Pirellulales bacterium]